MNTKFFSRILILFAQSALAFLLYSQEVSVDKRWFNEYRNSFGLQSLIQDELLDLTARNYAKEIARTGNFSHTDLNGQRAQSRYLANGGTHALIGEILGIGPDADKIVNGWLHSEKHLTVIKDDRWTHFGQGFFFIKGKLIYVLLFSAQFTKNLSIFLNDNHQIWNLKGQWLLPDKQPVLYNGTHSLRPDSWDQSTDDFSFQIRLKDLSAYLRLGYQDPGKPFYVTNIFYPFK